MSKKSKVIKTTDDWIEEYERYEISRKHTEEQSQLNDARDLLRHVMKERLKKWKNKYPREDLHMNIDIYSIREYTYGLEKHWGLVTTEEEALKCFYAVAPPSGNKTEWSVKYEKDPCSRTTLIVNIVPKSCTKPQ